MFGLNVMFLPLLFSHFTAGILFSPRDICYGERVTFRCSKMGASTIWKYSGYQVGRLYTWQPPGARAITTLSGIEFTATRDKGRVNQVMSTLSFVAKLIMNNKIITCIGDEGIESATIQVNDDGSPPVVSNIDTVDVLNGSTFTTVNVKWHVINGRGISTIQVLPFPVSQQIPHESKSNMFSANITLLYNINYNLTIRTVNCAGENSQQLNLLRVSCTPLPTTLFESVEMNASRRFVEGETVNFRCLSGQVMTATCSKSNWGVGTWKPNPELFNCSILSAKGQKGLQSDSSGVVIPSVIYGVISFMVGTLVGVVAGVGIVTTYFCNRKTIKTLSPPNSHSSSARVSVDENIPPLAVHCPVAGLVNKKDTSQLSEAPTFAGLVVKGFQPLPVDPPVAGSDNKDNQPLFDIPPVAGSIFMTTQSLSDIALQPLLATPPVAGSIFVATQSLSDIGSLNEMIEL